MSATLRHDVSEQLFNLISHRLAVTSLGFKQTSRWGGVGNPRWHCQTFALKLPKQVTAALAFTSTLYEIVCDDSLDKVNHKSALLLHAKIMEALGLPHDFHNLFCDLGKEPLERGFLEGIRENAEDFAAWSAYCDWLQEQPDTVAVTRGKFMAAWLAKKPAKVKYGRVVLGREDGSH